MFFCVDFICVGSQRKRSFQWNMGLKFWKESHLGDGKVIFTRPFLMLDKVTFDEQVHVLARYCKSDILYTFIKY